jgi:hypothetical protein
MRSLIASFHLAPALALVAFGTVPNPGNPPPRLAGVWEYNPEKSEVSRRASGGGFPMGGRGGPGGGGGYPGGRGGRGGGRGGRGGQGGEELPPDEFPTLGPGGTDRGIQELLRAKQRLEINQTDSSVVIRDDAGWEREIYPDGRKMREELSQGGPAEVESRWKGDKLVTDRKLDRGAEISETYSLDRKTGALVVQLEMKSKRMPRTISLKRVYDPEPKN